MVRALEEDYKSAPISEQDRVMLDYVVQVTKDATRISPADHERLRAVGFDDRGILQIRGAVTVACLNRWSSLRYDHRLLSRKPSRFASLHLKLEFDN